MTLKLSIERLENRIMDYAWGSTTAIPELLGRPNPGNKPQAELWMGAHHKAPSHIVRHGVNLPLDTVIAGAPADVLGESVAAGFDNKLPFLFKVLASGAPLSIQAHPSIAQAREGFARENNAGIPLDAFNRNYHDDNHKPELICALTPFWALKGFRPIDSILDIFDKLGVATFQSELDSLRRSPTSDGLKNFFLALMTAPKEAQNEAVKEAVRAACKPDDSDPVTPLIVKLNEKYPGDIGVLCAAMLNIVHLQPGQALYLPAGELHGYSEGLAIEIMANSDNVLRGGLTPKNIDVPELLKVLAFQPDTPSIIEPVEKAASEKVYATPASEFELSVIEPTAGHLYESPLERNVEILICVEGRANIQKSDARTGIEVSNGAAVLVPACVGQYLIEGNAKIYKATVPSPK